MTKHLPNLTKQNYTEEIKTLKIKRYKKIKNDRNH